MSFIQFFISSRLVVLNVVTSFIIVPVPLVDGVWAVAVL